MCVKKPLEDFIGLGVVHSWWRSDYGTSFQRRVSKYRAWLSLGNVANVSFYHSENDARIIKTPTTYIQKKKLKKKWKLEHKQIKLSKLYILLESQITLQAKKERNYMKFTMDFAITIHLLGEVLKHCGDRWLYKALTEKSRHWENIYIILWMMDIFQWLVI